MERIFILGAGAVGTGLALALAESQHEVVGTWSRSEAGRQRAERLTGLRAVTGSLADGVPSASMLLICVADGAVAEIGAALAKSGRVAPDAVVAHTSGCLAGAAIGPIGISPLGSLHPLVALPEPERAARALIGATFVVEGDAAVVSRLGAVVSALEGRVVEVRAQDKPRYHAAAVMASNLVVALVDLAVSEASAAGLPDSRVALVDLAVGALAAARDMDHAHALTGPVARGDDTTVRAHLQQLGPEARPIYEQLSRRAIDLAATKGLSPEAIARLRSLL